VSGAVALSSDVHDRRDSQREQQRGGELETRCALHQQPAAERQDYEDGREQRPAGELGHRARAGPFGGLGRRLAEAAITAQWIGTTFPVVARLNAVAGFGS
jgi:hypothetical protein